MSMLLCAISRWNLCDQLTLCMWCFSLRMPIAKIPNPLPQRSRPTSSQHQNLARPKRISSSDNLQRRTNGKHRSSSTTTDRKPRLLTRKTRILRNYISPWIKCLLFSFNFMFWVSVVFSWCSYLSTPQFSIILFILCVCALFGTQVAGLAISGIGSWIMIEKERVIRDALDIFFDPSILLFVAGCIIFTLGFLGCLGALRETICLLKTVIIDTHNSHCLSLSLSMKFGLVFHA